MTPPLLVALDQGTSVTRAAAWRDGRLVAEARLPLSSRFPGPSRAEQDPDEIATTARDVIASVLRSEGAGGEAVLGVANQRSTVVLWDAATLRPFGPALSWRDARAELEADELLRAVPDLPRRTGLLASPHYGAPKIAWALRHWPEARRAAESGSLRVGPVSTWTIAVLSGGRTFTIDATNAQRMLLLDVETLRWDDALVEAAGLPRPALPEVRGTTDDLGAVEVDGRALRVRVALGDQQAALAGLGDRAEDRALVQLGTGGFVLRDTGAATTRIDGLLTGIARVDPAPRMLVEGPINAAGATFDRLRSLGILLPDEDVDAACARATEPATVVPAWSGLAAPWWAPRAKGLIACGASSTREDVVAGAVHGLAFLVAHVVERMQASSPLRGLDLAGSVAQVACVSQAIADATRLEVRVLGDPESTLHGLATLLSRDANAGPPPALALPGRVLRPARDLSAGRALFDAACRDAVARA